MGENFTRNFCIISHIDHGKSTLADRFLELTGAVAKEKMRPQYLDSMDLEQEKGITIKMHPVRMQYSDYILNLIDTPGHIDFSYEISRALACVEGAILLVDATKGIQAQTLFNLEQAQRQGLVIIGAVNKIDAASEDQIDEVRKELAALLGQKQEDIFLVSAKTGQNIKQLLDVVLERVPYPKSAEESPVKTANGQRPLKALVFDSKYDAFLGVVAYLRIFQGEVKKGDRIFLLAPSLESEVKEIGFFSPELEPCQKLQTGEIGYVKTGIKEPGKLRVGDTVTVRGFKTEPLPGYKEPQPVLFLTLYPEDANEFNRLKLSLEKLRLNEPSLTFQIPEESALGKGLRVGFLGALQAEVVLRRLKAEFGVNLVSTLPQVAFKVLTKQDREIEVSSPREWPDPSEIKQIKEPMALIEIITPNRYFNHIFRILSNYKASLTRTESLTPQKSLLVVGAPLREIIGGKFYDDIKSKTKGHGSFSFRTEGEELADLVKLDVLILGRKEESFSRIVPRDKAFSEGKKILKKLKEVLPAQQFIVPLQAVVGGKIIARETIKARRKDVTAPLYGGDVTRKRKLLEKQKKGKMRLKEKGRIKIPSQVYLEILKS